MKNKRMYAGATINDSKAYIIGGIDENEQVLSSIEEYDVKEKKWKLISVGEDRTNKRFNHSVVNVTI